MKKAARTIGWTLLWLIVTACLAATIVPAFLDRVYYRGPVSDHFDGQRFFNPDGEDTVRPPTGGSRGGFFARMLTDDRPEWPDRIDIQRARPPARVDGDRMLVTWMGHASLLIQTQGLNILTDPIVSRTAGPFGIGPQRIAPSGIGPNAMPKIDLIVVSHNHYDHLDLATLKRYWDRDRPRIVTALGNDAIMAHEDIEATALDWGGRANIRPGIDVVVMRNHHWSSRWFTDRNRALWSAFAITLPGGNIFFSGDTGLGDGSWADEAAALGPVRFAAIPIGAFRFEEGQMGTGNHIGPVDAVEVYRRLGAARALGVHWGTFRLSYEARDTPPRLLAAALACTGQTGFGTVEIAGQVEVPAYVSPRAMQPIDREALLACLDTPKVRALR
ncbi:MBL fold metallo-hydrolase [Sphingomonas baiyangensis]|uniref:Zn-dependent hydrolase n=1 Tax=Sphingomonas baiyangensis TaxID=2572576 RepID=A0A4V5PV58_9SPHN|nr:MBL fold metallo-hydrolase [Sphingomonas baiyangensis]TKD52818.1 Zn-dependent hydrolase [Sphingomonas baiyangensis]